MHQYVASRIVAQNIGNTRLMLNNSHDSFKKMMSHIQLKTKIDDTFNQNYDLKIQIVYFNRHVQNDRFFLKLKATLINR